jgi:predicted porin
LKDLTMKTYSVLAVAALSSLASLAQAQSKVEVFGLLDVSYLHTSASGSGSVSSLDPDGNTSSRLGFKGTEDLGGGLSASFWLEAAVSPDSGVGGSTSTNNIDSNNSGGLTFARRSTVSLEGKWGELRLGRDYTPTFNNLAVAMHPFGTNGVGNAGQLFYQVNTGGTTARTNVRASNAINYLLPSELGGVYGQVMYAMGEQISGLPGAKSDDGTYLGGRIGYRSGPLNLAGATGTTKYATGNFTQSNFAINYKVGPAKLMYLWGKNEVGVTSTTVNMVGTQWEVGPGEVRFAYTTLKADGVANDANQWAIGYVYNLSKRSALYANYSVVDNDGTGTKFTVGSGNNVTTPGGNSTGYQIGMRHSF